MNGIRISARYGTHKVYEYPTSKTCMDIEGNIKAVFVFMSAFIGTKYMIDEFVLILKILPK